MSPVSDQEFHEVSTQVQLNTQALKSHEIICAERYGNINDAIKELKNSVSKFLWWIIAILIGVCGFLIQTSLF
jgi:hypothetical protein